MGEGSRERRPKNLAGCCRQVLLFCTMTRALDVIEEYLGWRGFEFARLDGSTAAAERGGMVADFNAPGASRGGAGKDRVVVSVLAGHE